MLDGEASLQLQCAIIVDHPANADGATTDQIQCKHDFTFILQRGTGLCIKSQRCRHRNVCLYKERPALTDLYSSSLLTQAFTSREGSLASRLIQDRADILQMELPSLTTRRLALVSFPVGVGSRWGGRCRAETRDQKQRSAATQTQRHYLAHDTRNKYGLWFDTPCHLPDRKAASTCRHVKEEGEDAPPVIASPKDPPRSIKGERQHAACQLTGAPLHLLSSGDVHHLQVVFAVSYLQHMTGSEKNTGRNTNNCTITEKASASYSVQADDTNNTS